MRSDTMISLPWKASDLSKSAIEQVETIGDGLASKARLAMPTALNEGEYQKAQGNAKEDGGIPESKIINQRRVIHGANFPLADNFEVVSRGDAMRLINQTKKVADRAAKLPWRFDFSH